MTTEQEERLLALYGEVCRGREYLAHLSKEVFTSPGFDPKEILTLARSFGNPDISLQGTRLGLSSFRLDDVKLLEDIATAQECLDRFKAVLEPYLEASGLSEFIEGKHVV